MNLLKPIEAAKKLAVSTSTLRSWRHRNVGPPFVQLSAGMHRYPLEGLQKYIAERTKHG